LDTKDLYRALKEHKSGKMVDFLFTFNFGTNYIYFKETLGNKLSSAWEIELETHKEKASLMRVLLRVFGWYFGFLGVVLFVVEVISTVQPIFLVKLISSFNDGSDSFEPAYAYAALMILCSALTTMIKHPHSFAITHLGKLITLSFL